MLAGSTESDMGKFDATRVAPKLYVGGFPPAGLREKGFDAVVLCAQEKQDVSPDIYTIRVPYDDNNELSRKDYERAVKAAVAVTKLRKAGKRVLVTCHMGINRSALVAAFSLMLMENMSADVAIQRVRAMRGPVVPIRPLSNPAFVRALHHFERNGLN